MGHGTWAVVKALRPTVLGLLGLFAIGQRAEAASPATTCTAQLRQVSGASGAEDALRACLPLFREPNCQEAWVELLDNPRASPGYGRGASVARLAEACEKAYCHFPGMGRQQLCTGRAPSPLSAEFFDAWRTFQTEVLRREHVAPSTSERLAQALISWAGFVPRPGARHVLQAVTRLNVPGVVALTLWSVRGERLGAWVADVELDEVTLNAVVAAVPAPPPEAQVPCLRVEASFGLPHPTEEALLQALRRVCPLDVVRVNDA